MCDGIGPTAHATAKAALVATLLDDHRPVTLSTFAVTHNLSLHSAAKIMTSVHQAHPHLIAATYIRILTDPGGIRIEATGRDGPVLEGKGKKVGDQEVRLYALGPKFVSLMCLKGYARLP